MDLVKRSSLYDYFILPCFALPLLGFFWPAYILAGLHSLFKVHWNDIIQEKVLFISLVSFCIIKFLQDSSLATILFFKTFVGLYFFIFYFSYINKKSFEKILIALMTSYIIGEFFYRLYIQKYIFGRYFWRLAYPRPLGFGENASITTAILVVFLLFFSRSLIKKWIILLVTTIIISGSGVGYFGLIYYYFSSKWKCIKKNPKSAGIGLCIVLSLYSAFYILMGDNISTSNFLYKISPFYIIFLIKIKYLLLLNHVDLNLLKWDEILFGIRWSNSHYSGSDCGWYEVFLMSGVVGVIINFFLIINYFKDKRISIFILISLFHYSVIWWPAGQIFLGFIAGLNKRSKESEDHDHIAFSNTEASSSVVLNGI
ncbi:hypothetical protein SHI21_10495 [Bacteriovorax sp. PP10]|uniref:Uncharacterized protein n=1 Tax=Bacteriovorax antarcticus TaxID=3088717 RepID=A0ABU5VUM4_9BACT|nr:hypothetical protein [Bacteriovorax sp. PP10]MEA9356637.1 hypothetical protein [Bacteriovorax sp. PP10]